MLRLIFAAVLMLSPFAAFAQDNSAAYRIEIALDWSADPAEGHPADPHWSRLIAVAHSSRYALFEDGSTASSGLALVATNGRVSVLDAELAEARRRGRAGEPVVVPGLASGVGTFDLQLKLDTKLSHVAFVTMLAPSPDWFSGVSGVALYVDDAWLEQVRVPLWVWDAGADSGPDFEGPNVDTQPRQSVRLLTHPAFLRPDGMRPIGTATFTRLP
ncbi:spondin domain-containing protein [Tateyamaria armeniaca]|uniref:Spondin domain-containing protein n=1 Tax=Tateyamaria armeniaca TaxID=2518930 RepID=A0ABW8UNJ5_9RHOB